MSDIFNLTYQNRIFLFLFISKLLELADFENFVTLRNDLTEFNYLKFLGEKSSRLSFYMIHSCKIESISLKASYLRRCLKSYICKNRSYYKIFMNLNYYQNCTYLNSIIL